MNPFKKYKGLLVNGVHYAPQELLKASMSEQRPAHLREVFAFAAKLYSKSKSVKVATSGSTGKPKKMSFGKLAFEQSALATNAYFGLHATSHALHALPIRYIAGKMMVVRAVVGGYQLHVVEPSANPLMGITVPEGGFDFAPLTPYQAMQCVEDAPKALASIKHVLIGGGQVSDELRRKLSMTGVQAYASFGMTETLSHFAIAPLHDKEEMVYEPLQKVSLRISKKGLLRVRWKGITEGWLETNDLVSEHEKGFMWLGRNDNLINSGGIKVIPELVEKRIAHLIGTPFFVAGIPHDKLGEEVALFIQAEGKPPAALLNEVQHVLRDTPFWQPRQVQAIPRFEYTPTGKIMRLKTVKRWQS